VDFRKFPPARAMEHLSRAKNAQLDVFFHDCSPVRDAAPTIDDCVAAYTARLSTIRTLSLRCTQGKDAHRFFDAHGPAPVLERLEVAVAFVNECVHILRGTFTLPSTFVHGHAPHLRDLRLENCWIPAMWPPYAHLRALTLVFSYGGTGRPLSDILNVFAATPLLERLEMHRFYDYYNDDFYNTPGADRIPVKLVYLTQLAMYNMESPHIASIITHVLIAPTATLSILEDFFGGDPVPAHDTLFAALRPYLAGMGARCLDSTFMIRVSGAHTYVEARDERGPVPWLSLGLKHIDSETLLDYVRACVPPESLDLRSICSSAAPA
jgi:hypothetical protein